MTGPSDGMFEPFNEAELREAERAAPVDKGKAPQPIVRVPVDAPDLDWSRLRPKEATGEPVKIWLYHTADSEFAFYVARWKPRDPCERKVIRPATWCQFSDGRGEWAPRAMPAPRPLYNLPAILETPAKAVVVVEGERCADTAAHVFLDHAATTWAGGSHAWKLTDWQPLAGRDVLLVADSDDPGRDAMRAIAAHLTSMACVVRVHLPPGDDGCDIADALDRDGEVRTRELIEAEAKPWKPETSAAPDAGDSADWMTELVERSKTDPGAPFELEMVARLTGLQRESLADWQRLRANLKGSDIRVTDLDRELSRFPDSDHRGNLQSQPAKLDEVEPWPEPVDGIALLAEMARLFRHYVSLPEGGAEAVALWALYTWVFDAFGVCPNLMVTAPERESGKTRVTELLSWTAARAKPVSDASAAAIVRRIERDHPTLLFDEAQHFLRRRPDDPIRGILLASFNRRFAFVDRCEGDNHEPHLYSTFTPKAMNGRKLAALDDMLTSRSVVIPMTRARTRYPDLRADRDPVGENLRRECARWRDDHMTALRGADPDMGGLFGRIADVWRPLFAVANAAGGDWPRFARHAAMFLAKQTSAIASGDTLSVQLLRDIRHVFADRGNPDRLSTADLDDALTAMSERPWATLSNGKPMTPQKRGRMLADYGIHTTKVRVGEKTRNVYLKSAFEPAWEAWLRDAPAPEPEHRNNDTESDG